MVVMINMICANFGHQSGNVIPIKIGWHKTVLFLVIVVMVKKIFFFKYNYIFKKSNDVSYSKF